MNDEENITLGELVEWLKAVIDERGDVVFRMGFEKPHSYRGYYDQVAFWPAANVRLSQMLEAAQKAVGATYTGYKGGEFEMGRATDVWLAQEGCCGAALTRPLLWQMLSVAPKRRWSVSVTLVAASDLVEQAIEVEGVSESEALKAAERLVQELREEHFPARIDVVEVNDGEPA